MTSLRGLLLLLALIFTATVPAVVQADAPEATPAVSVVDSSGEEDLIEVEWGDIIFHLEPLEPQQTCVLKTSADFDGQYVQVIVWVRQLNGIFTPLGVYDTRATGGLANAQVGACIGLAQ